MAGHAPGQVERGPRAEDRDAERKRDEGPDVMVMVQDEPPR